MFCKHHNMAAQEVDGATPWSENIVDNTDSQKNTKLIVCKFCSSKILRENTCSITDKSFTLPCMKSKNKDDNPELITKSWLIVDMMTFENVGFTRTVEGLKYLTCADCEIGPIGYQDQENLKHLYVAVDRVMYK